MVEIVVDNTVDVSKALTLRLRNGLSYQNIANQFGVTKQSVHNALKPFIKLLRHPEHRETYKANKADLLEGVEMLLVSDLADPGKRQKASLNNTAFAADKVHSMVRLERDQSTQNVLSYHEHHLSTTELDDRLKELRGLLGDEG